jgi:hypothetical protein
MNNKIIEESNLNIIENIAKKIMKDEVSFKVDKNLENNDLSNLDIIEKFCDNNKLSK